MSSRPRIVVVGAGLGGVCASVALQRAGFEVVLCEQAQRIEDVRLGWGMAVWPNGMLALQRVGVADAVEAATVEIPVLSLYTGTGAKLRAWPVQDVGRDIGAMTVGASRADLHRVLSDALDPDTLRLGRRCIGFEEEPLGVVVRFEDGSEERGDVLIAADGRRSGLRAQVGNTPDGFPPYAGYTLLHAVIPAPDGLIERGTFDLFFGRGTRFAYFYVDQARLYWSGIAYVDPGGRDPPGGSRQAVLERYAGYPSQVGAMIEATPEESIHRGDIFGGVPLSSWGAGRMTLLGDAAHPMTTVLGQGACMAMEDGVVLAESLVEHGVPDGLRAYEERRIARTTAMMAVSDRLNSSASRESAFRGWLRNTAIRFAFKRGIGDRYEALMRAPF